MNVFMNRNYTTYFGEMVGHVDCVITWCQSNWDILIVSSLEMWYVYNVADIGYIHISVSVPA